MVAEIAKGIHVWEIGWCSLGDRCCVRLEIDWCSMMREDVCRNWRNEIIERAGMTIYTRMVGSVFDDDTYFAASQSFRTEASRRLQPEETPRNVKTQNAKGTR